MSSTSSPTVSRRWLALEMKRLRQLAGLQQPDVAKALGCRVPKISHIENEQRLIQVDDLKTLLELFDVPDEDRQQYFDEAENAHKKGWWERYDEAAVPEWYRRFIGIEQGAVRIRAYQPAIIHGLLQTPEYAARVLGGTVGELSIERIERSVEIRRRRQRMLAQGARAPKLSVVLDEAALRHVVGDSEVMRQQLLHVVDLCRANKHITVQVVPFDHGGAYEAAHGAFTVLTFGLPADPGIVYRERRSDADFLDSLSEIDDHSLIFQRLSELALAPARSVSMLEQCALDYA